MIEAHILPTSIKKNVLFIVDRFWSRNFVVKNASRRLVDTRTVKVDWWAVMILLSVRRQKILNYLKKAGHKNGKQLINGSRKVDGRQ